MRCIGRVSPFRTEREAIMPYYRDPVTLTSTQRSALALKRGEHKAEYHKENRDYRVMRRGTLFYAQRRTGAKATRECDGWSDMHRGTDHDTATKQMGAAVAKAKQVAPKGWDKIEA